jgi:serine/threonine protein kinase
VPPPQPLGCLFVSELLGDMMEYVSKQADDLRTDDVSRIAFQLLSAVDHCARHNVIHRDIKAENVMFTLPSPGSDMKLIDFGSGTDKVVVEGDHHTTFAGSAFCKFFRGIP